MLRGGRLSPNVPGELRTGEALEGPKSSVCPWCFLLVTTAGSRPLVTMQPPGLVGKRTSRGHAPDREELG